MLHLVCEFALPSTAFEQTRRSDVQDRSTKALVASIGTWITGWNENPRPFVWHKTSDEILERLAGYCERISDPGH